MRIALFCHSLISDWNHGNAHFLRWVATELMLRGADVRIYDPRTAWSYHNLVREQGSRAVAGCGRAFPHLLVFHDALHHSVSAPCGGL